MVKPEDFLKASNKALAKHQFAEALACLEQALSIAPQHREELYVRMGNVYYAQGKIEDAKKHYQMAIELDPDYGEPYFGLGIIYKDSGLFAEAIPCLQKASTLFPDSASPLGSLGQVFRELKDYPKALKYFRAAVKCNPSYWLGHYNIGQCHDDLKKYHLAIQYYEKAYALADEIGKIFSGRPICGVLLSLNRPKKFKFYLNEFLNFPITKENTNYREYLIQLMGLEKYSLQLNKNEVARQCLAKIIELAPEYSDIIEANSSPTLTISETNQLPLTPPPKAAEFYTEIAALYSRYNQPQKALQLCRKAYKIDPSQAEPYVGMADCYRKLGQPSKAYWYLSKGLKKHPKNTKLHMKKWHFLQGQEDFKRLIPFSQQLLEWIADLNDIALICLGFCVYYSDLAQLPELTHYMERLLSCLEHSNCNDQEIIKDVEWLSNRLSNKKLYEHADLCLQKLMNFRPKHYYAYQQLGIIQDRLGNKDEAMTLYKKAIECPQPEWYSFVNLGLIYEDKKVHDRAIEAFEQALALAPEEANCWSGLAANHLMAGNPKKGQAYFDDGLQKFPNNFLIQYHYAFGLSEIDRNEEAAALMKSVIAIAPPDYLAKVYEGLRNLYKTLGDNEKQNQYAALLKELKANTEAQG